MSTEKSILVVDDEPTVLSALSIWLTRSGYRVQCAADGREAVRAIQADCPDILITDWQMPNMDGIQLCRWLRGQELPKEVYTLFLTVRCEVEAVVEALSAGADDFLSKPVHEEELLSRVHLASRRVETAGQRRQPAKLEHTQQAAAHAAEPQVTGLPAESESHAVDAPEA